MKSRKNILRLTDDERKILAKPAIYAGVVFTFFLLVVITGISHSLDVFLVLDLRHSHRWTDQFFKIVESPGQRRFVYPLAIIASIVFTIRRKDLLPTIVTVASLLFTNAVTGVFKILTARGFPRTAGPEVFNFPPITGTGWTSATFRDFAANLGAFPSGHAANIAAASTLMVLAAYSARPKFRPYATHITILTSIVCVITFISSWLRDTHWVTDLAAGLALGICTTIAATMWALHLPDHWRHPDMAGRPRLVIFGFSVVSIALVFMFAGNSFLSHSGSSALLVVGTLLMIARSSQQSYKRSKKANSEI